MRKLEVGHLFEEGKTHYAEGCRFDFSGSIPTLFLLYDRPTSKEIHEIKRGIMSIAFKECEDIIFLFFRFGTSDWIETPYSVHLSEPFEFQEISEGMGLALNIFLVDSSNGILKALRAKGLSTEFSRKLKSAIEIQKNKEFDKNLYFNRIAKIENAYTTVDLMKMGCIYDG